MEGARQSTRDLSLQPFLAVWRIFAQGGLLLGPTFVMAVGFTLFSDGFGKLGVALSLPAGIGSIPNFQPKLFPMEIFLSWVGVVTLASLRPSSLRRAGSPLLWLTASLFVFGLARATVDFRENPLLVIRSSAFVWYLALPLAIALYPVTSLRWEEFMRLLYRVIFAYFCVCLFFPVITGEPGKIFWSIDLGLMLGLAYGLCSDHRRLPAFALGAIGFALGLSFVSQIQRTTLIGLGLTVAMMAVAYLLPVPRPSPKWARTGWILAGIALAIAAAGLSRAAKAPKADVVLSGVDVVTQANPMRISENVAPGVEKFRLFMWKDAWDLFLSSPALGIGFLKPVVFRAYSGAGAFLENTGSFEQLSQFRFEKTSPPIAGPHNSYLNCLARMGVFGFGFLLLHLWAAWLFARNGYFACLFVLVWQMLYAMFNVSFEGPIRSFPILVVTGVALKLAAETAASKRKAR